MGGEGPAPAQAVAVSRSSWPTRRMIRQTFSRTTGSSGDTQAWRRSPSSQVSSSIIFWIRGSSLETMGSSRRMYSGPRSRAARRGGPFFLSAFLGVTKMPSGSGACPGVIGRKYPRPEANIFFQVPPICAERHLPLPLSQSHPLRAMKSPRPKASATPAPTRDDLQRLELKIAQRADQLSQGKGHAGSLQLRWSTGSRPNGRSSPGGPGRPPARCRRGQGRLEARAAARLDPLPGDPTAVRAGEE